MSDIGSLTDYAKREIERSVTGDLPGAEGKSVAGRGSHVVVAELAESFVGVECYRIESLGDFRDVETKKACTAYSKANQTKSNESIPY